MQQELELRPKYYTLSGSILYGLFRFKNLTYTDLRWKYLSYLIFPGDSIAANGEHMSMGIAKPKGI